MKNYRIRILVCSILFFTSFSIAQHPQLEIVGKGQRADREFVGRMDQNGRYCAAIVVLSNLDGFSYQAWNGVVGNVEDEQGKDIVFLQPDERVLEIYRSGFEPIKIILSEIGIQLSQKSLWEIRIKGEERKLPTDIEEGIPTPLKVTSLPEGADIYLNDKSIGQTPFNQNIPSGVYDIRVQRDKFYSSDDKLILVPGKNKNLNYELKPRLARVIVSSKPGASIYINNKVIKTGNLQKDLLIGSYEIKASLDKHNDAVQRIKLVEGDVKRVALNPEPRYGVLELNVLPSQAKGADIYLNGKNYGKTPQRLNLFEGKYSLKIDKKGYEIHVENIQIDFKRSKSKSIKLIAVDVKELRKELEELEETKGRYSRYLSNTDELHTGSSVGTLAGFICIVPYLPYKMLSSEEFLWGKLSALGIFSAGIMVWYSNFKSGNYYDKIDKLPGLGTDEELQKKEEYEDKAKLHSTNMFKYWGVGLGLGVLRDIMHYYIKKTQIERNEKYGDQINELEMKIQQHTWKDILNNHYKRLSFNYNSIYRQPMLTYEIHF